jgi:tetratricopeptide (TPR) repeat protein
MEITLVAVPFAIYVLYWVYYGDHDTALDKDKKYFSIGINLFESRKFDEALTFFENALKSKPKSALAWLMKGKCHTALENYYSANFCFEQSIVFDNTIPETYFEKGKAHYLLDDFVQAIYEFDKAEWHFHETNTNIYRWRSMTFYQLGKQNEARKDIEKAAFLGDERANLLIISNQVIDYTTLI